LRTTRQLLPPTSVLQNTCVQPFPDEPQDSGIRNPVLEKAQKPLVVDGVKETTNVCIEHPVHSFALDSRRKRVQRHVLATALTEPVRKTEKVFFVNGVQHLGHGALDDLVLQRGDPQRPLAAAGLWYERSTRRLRSIRSSVNSPV
jgi:hypothetical protein